MCLYKAMISPSRLTYPVLSDTKKSVNLFGSSQLLQKVIVKHIGLLIKILITEVFSVDYFLVEKYCRLIVKFQELLYTILATHMYSECYRNVSG